MTTEESVQKIKTFLRFGHSKLDEEIMDTIDECLADLRFVGINAAEAEKVIFSAIKLYCKAAFSEDPDEAAKWMSRYEDLKKSLQIATDNGESTDE